MDRRVWFSRRALKLHAVLLIVVPGFMALCVWQITRALDGNSLSWAYVFEWPLFAVYAVYMWWRLVHEGAEEETPPAAAHNGVRRPDRCGPDIGRRRARPRRTLPQPTPPLESSRRRRTPSSLPTTSTWRSWPSRTRLPVAEESALRGEGSNLQHPAPKADVLPIELPRTEASARARLGPPRPSPEETRQ